jgi:hypothetical protein
LRNTSTGPMALMRLPNARHAGGHTPGPNWPTFLMLADRCINVPPVPTEKPAADATCVRPLSGAGKHGGPTLPRAGPTDAPVLRREDDCSCRKIGATDRGAPADKVGTIEIRAESRRVFPRDFPCFQDTPHLRERLCSFSFGSRKFFPGKKSKAGTVYPVCRFSNCRTLTVTSCVRAAGHSFDRSHSDNLSRGGSSIMRGSLGVAQPDHRSDLHVIVESALARSSYLSGRNLRFEVHEDGVVLRGVVRSYYQKQLAQESLKSIAGLPRIQNEIEVVTV